MKSNTPLLLLALALAVYADDYVDTILARHNAVRAKYGLSALTWDKDSAQVAQNYASVSQRS